MLRTGWEKEGAGKGYGISGELTDMRALRFSKFIVAFGATPRAGIMRAFVFIIGVALFLVALADATRVTPCTDDPEARVAEGTVYPDDKIKVSGCTKPPCRLRRKTTVTTEFRFTPTSDIKTLRNEVNAKILGIPFPFLGVDNTNACNQIYQADGVTKAGCPLKANTEYVYKNPITILEIYPRIKLLVHWALVADDKSKPLCFNVPARIV